MRTRLSEAEDFLLSARIGAFGTYGHRAELMATADETTEFEDDGSFLCHYDVPHDYRMERQERFEAALRGVTTRLQVLAENGLLEGTEMVELRVTLLPTSESQAGLVFPEWFIHDWAQLDGCVAIDAFPP